MNDIVKSIPKFPHGLAQEAVDQLIDRGIEPSPENLVRVSKTDTTAVLYEFFKTLPAEKLVAWAEYQIARKIIQAAKETVVIGGKTVVTRKIEQVVVGDERRYVTYQQLTTDVSLRKALMRDIESTIFQAGDKMRRLRAIDEQIEQ